MKKKIDSLGRIVIPYDLRKEIELKNGDEANIELDNNKIIITKPGSIDYKSRCEKAIEYISNSYVEVLKYYDEPSETGSYELVTVDLLKILKGEE